MDFKSLLESMYKSIQAFIDGWIVKSAISVCISIASSPEYSAFSAFISLIFIDLITKWLAISYKYLLEKHVPEENLDLISCFTSMGKAFKCGYINSDMMKHRFCGKILWYLIITISAAKADAMLMNAGECKMFLHSAWVYLALTEASSILENLRDAGVQQAGDLLNLLRERLNILLERFKQK